MRVDCISRIRDASGQWNHYTDEDIQDRMIVLTGVVRIAIEPEGPLPSEDVSGLEVQPTDMTAASGEALYEFTLLTGGITQDGTPAQVVIRAVGTGLNLRDPKAPDTIIDT